MIGNIIKFLLLIILLGVIAYVGFTCYVNFVEKPGEVGNIPEPPAAAEASYSVYVENTGELYFTDNIEQHGDTPGKRLYVLSGYWHTSGQKFNYRADTAILDENIFGKITVKRRN